MSILKPLPYHHALLQYLRQEDEEVWNWFEQTQKDTTTDERVRLDLLKTSYRIKAEDEAELYALARRAATKLELDVPITLYRAQDGSADRNAALAPIAGHAHVIFSGGVLSLLEPLEREALLAHELAHLKLWHGWDGAFQALDRLVAAMTFDSQAHEAHIHSARLLSLYTEIFCDRAALSAVSNLDVVVGMLVKVTTGASSVNAQSYLEQSREILEAGHEAAMGLSHPEAFLRARALELWAKCETDEETLQAEATIRSLIEGPLCFDRLDLLSQKRVERRTRELLDATLGFEWLRTELVLAHAQLYFSDYQPATALETAELAARLGSKDKGLLSYWSYVLLDLVTADSELGDAALAAGLDLSERAGFGKVFERLLKKELSLAPKRLGQLAAEREQLLQDAGTQRRSA